MIALSKKLKVSKGTNEKLFLEEVLGRYKDHRNLMKTSIITEKIGNVLWYIPKTLVDIDSGDIIFDRLREIGSDSFLKNCIDVDSSTTNDMKLQHNVTGKRFNLIKYGRSKQFGSTNFLDKEGKHDVYIKVFNCTSLLIKFKHLFLPSKARREFFLSFKIRENGIPAVFSIAVGEKRCFGILKRSYFIIKKIDNVLNLNEFFFNTELHPLERHAVLEEFGRTAALCHRKGILQTDFALNNFLVQRLCKNKYRVFLIDYERTKMGGHVTGKRELWILAKLNRMGPDFSTVDKLRFLKAYLDEGKDESKGLTNLLKAGNLIRNIDRETVNILRAGVEEMWKTCIKHHRKFKEYQSGVYCGYYLKGYDAEFLISILNSHKRRIFMKEMNFSASTANISSFVIDYDEGETCEKFMVHRVESSDDDFINTFWQNSNALSKGKINVLEPLGVFIDVINPVGKNRLHKVTPQASEGFILTSFINSVLDIKDFVNKLYSLVDRETFFFKLALFICRIHSFGTFVSEISSYDIVIQQNRYNKRYNFLFLHTYNFLLNTSADHEVRWRDVEWLVLYLINEVSISDLEYFKKMYIRYEKWYF